MALFTWRHCTTDTVAQREVITLLHGIIALHLFASMTIHEDGLYEIRFQHITEGMLHSSRGYCAGSRKALCGDISTIDSAHWVISVTNWR